MLRDEIRVSCFKECGGVSFQKETASSRRSLEEMARYRILYIMYLLRSKKEDFL